MSRILVTGGAGFIGSNLVDQLINLNHEVLVIDNLSTGKVEYLNEKAKFANISIDDNRKLKISFKNFRPEYVFHLAALPRIQPSIKEPIPSHKVNVNGTLNILELSRHYNVKRVIYSASSSAYGDQEEMPLTEEMKPMPKNPYALQKYIGEQYCQLYSHLYNLSTVCLRYFNVYGKRQSFEGAYATVIGIFLRQKEAGESLTVVGDGLQRRDFTHVSEVAEANLKAMESDKVGSGEVINIGTGSNVSVLGLADMIGGKVVHIPERPGESRETKADNNKANELLDWHPSIHIKEGLKLCEST